MIVVNNTTNNTNNCTNQLPKRYKAEGQVNRCATNTTNRIESLSKKELKEVDDYKYLGSFISSSTKDFNTRKGMAWSACNDMHRIWSSQLSEDLKLKIFRVTIEPILLYGSETWTLSRKIEQRLDGTYTRLLMRVKNISWRDHCTKQQIYGNLVPPSILLRARRVQFSGHCLRAQKEVISSLVLWSQRHHRRGKLSYPDVISRDTNIEKTDLEAAMRDREFWRSRVDSIISTAVER